MGDFLTFRRMITPVIIQIVFWIGIVAVVIVGLVQLFGDEPFLGLVALILGPLGVRIYCEILILFFRMNETLTDIYRELELGRTAGGAAPAWTPGPSYGSPTRTP